MLADVGPGNTAFDTEIFGPVAPVAKFGTLDEPVDIVKASEYGSSLGILARDAYAALEFSERLPAGTGPISKPSPRRSG